MVPADLAAAYITDDVPDAKTALEGARDILSEGFAENADLVGRLRNYHEGESVPAIEGCRGQGRGRREILRLFRSHRALVHCAQPSCAGHAARYATRRCCTVDIEVDADDTSPVKPVEQMIAETYNIGRQGRRPIHGCMGVVGWTWRVKLLFSLSLDLDARVARERRG